MAVRPFLLHILVLFIFVEICHAGVVEVGASTTTPLNIAPTKECSEPRPWVCYAYEWLIKEGLMKDYPDFIKYLIEHQHLCDNCVPISVVCGVGSRITLSSGGFPQIDDDCTVSSLFCAPTTPATKRCIRPVEVSPGEWVLFPLNLCTRQMLIDNKCPMAQIARAKPYDPAAPILTTDYYLHCDAGFTVPQKIAELKTCVPSLHIAAGFSQLNATDNIFPLELVTFSKDVPFSPMNPRRPTPKGEIPRAVCGSWWPDEVRVVMTSETLTEKSSGCQMICRYNGTGMYPHCIPYDVLDSDGHIYTAFRQRSPPFASFLTEEENLRIGWAPEANDSNLYRYPKCIKGKLPKEQAAIVAQDRFLNCRTNPFSLRDPSVFVSPKLQGGDSDPETFTRLPDEEGPSAWWAVLVIGVLLLLIAIFAIIFWLLWRKRGSGKSTPSTSSASSSSRKQADNNQPPANGKGHHGKHKKTTSRLPIDATQCSAMDGEGGKGGKTWMGIKIGGGHEPPTDPNDYLPLHCKDDVNLDSSMKESVIQK